MEIPTKRYRRWLRQKNRSQPLAHSQLDAILTTENKNIQTFNLPDSVLKFNSTTYFVCEVNTYDSQECLSYTKDIIKTLFLV